MIFSSMEENNLIINWIMYLLVRLLFLLFHFSVDNVSLNHFSSVTRNSKTINYAYPVQSMNSVIILNLSSMCSLLGMAKLIG